MLLVVENEVNPEFRYFGAAMRSHLPERELHDAPEDGGHPSLSGVEAVVVGGNTAGVYDRDDHPWMAREADLIRELVEREIPTLAVCFGHQLANHALGGRVEHRGLTNELVFADLEDDPLFDGVNGVLPAVHGDRVVETGEGMNVVASAEHDEHFGTRHRTAPLWTTQFHPEFGESLLPRVRGDFGWNANELSFSDVNAENVFENFLRLAGVSSKTEL